MSVTRVRPARLWRRLLSLLLILGLALSSAEVAWGDARVEGGADLVTRGIDQNVTPATPSSDGSAPHEGHDWDCPCLCACMCTGAAGAVLPAEHISDAPVADSGSVDGTPQQAPISAAPEPLLRPPLL
jgi:hypothetical protein